MCVCDLPHVNSGHNSYLLLKMQILLQMQSVVSCFPLIVMAKKNSVSGKKNSVLFVRFKWLFVITMYLKGCSLLCIFRVTMLMSRV